MTDPIRPGMARTTLSIEEVRMILRIYWTDIYQRKLIGLRGTPGVQLRIAKQFKVSRHVVKKITDMKGRRRDRFPTIVLRSIRFKAKQRVLRRIGGDQCKT